MNNKHLIKIVQEYIDKLPYINELMIETEDIKNFSVKWYYDNYYVIYGSKMNFNSISKISITNSKNKRGYSDNHHPTSNWYICVFY